MKLYQIIQTVGGKETVKMVDSLPVCNRRLKELRKSHRKDGYKFRMEPSDDTVKSEAKPAPGGYQSGSYGIRPPKAK